MPALLINYHNSKFYASCATITWKKSRKFHFISGLSKPCIEVNIATALCADAASARCAELNCSLTAPNCADKSFGNFHASFDSSIVRYILVFFQEIEIRYEIYTNGPVQGGKKSLPATPRTFPFKYVFAAVFHVSPDFFMYRSGVYRSSNLVDEIVPQTENMTGYHSVRIVGWGTDSSQEIPVNYWVSIL